MSSASTRFFNIVELTDMVTAYLNRPNTVALAQTSRRLLELCEPVLYTNLRLDYNPKRIKLFDSSHATLALARNIHYVRDLSISVIDLAMLAHCMLAYLDSTSDDNLEPRLDSASYHCSNTTTASSSSLSHVIPVPPMSNLERLETTLATASYAPTCFYYLETGNNPKTTLLQYCRLLDFSPHLTYLKAEWIPIATANGLRILAESLSSLSCLETLILDDVVANDDNWSCIGRTLFHSCGSSLRTFAVKMDRPFSQSRHLKPSSGRWSIVKLGLQELERASPALREAMQDLTMWATGDSTASEHELLSILQRCPNLKRLALPGTQYQTNHNTIGQFLVNHCPKVTSLAFLDFQYIGNTVHLLTPFWVMSSMPVQRIEEFKWTRSSEHLTPGRASVFFRNHAEVLRKIVIVGCSQVHSSAIQVILTQCPMLEHLQVGIEGGKEYRGSTIVLSDAIAIPWVCTKLQVLDLAIVIPEMPALEPDQEPCYARPVSQAYSNGEVEQYAEYKKLYQQIGLLTSLTHLALRVVFEVFRTYWGSYYHDSTKPFPAMLNLPSNDAYDRQGYLDLWRGLTQLKELRGSVNTNYKETQMTMGWEEARWMAKHWPELKVVAFARSVDELREPFLWLQKERDLVVDSSPHFQW